MNKPPPISFKQKVIGTTLIAIGFLALVTPFTPGGFLFFVGLEMIGVRVFFGRSLSQWMAYFLSKIKRGRS